MPTAPAFSLLHPGLQHLFIACFEHGHGHPRARPDAHAWQKALREAERALISCPVNEQHLYSDHCLSCPWCERTELLGGRDPFPSRQAVQRRDHLQVAPPAQTPLPLAQTPRATRASSPLHTPLPPTRPTSVAVAPSLTPTLSPAPRRPSRAKSALTGAVGGALSGALLSILMQLILAPSLVSQPFPEVLWTLGWRARWSVVWGLVWGFVWGVCRRPAVPASQGGPSPLSRLLSGVILGSGLGIAVSVLVGMTPVGLHNTPDGAVAERLLNMGWSTALPAFRQLLLQWLAGLQTYALSGAVVGGVLGLVWGACQR
jgi:hypothetical protein